MADNGNLIHGLTEALSVDDAVRVEIATAVQGQQVRAVLVRIDETSYRQPVFATLSDCLEWGVRQEDAA